MFLDFQPDHESFLYTLLDTDYYTDPVDTLVAMTYTKVLKELLPEKEWDLTDAGLWIIASPYSIKLPGHGFKFHVSGTKNNFIHILSAVTEVLCASSRVAFKVVKNEFLKNYLLSGRNCSLKLFGKLITIYPSDQSTNGLKTLGSVLVDALQDFVGVDILTDEPLTGSAGCLYYRYGAIVENEELLENGTKRIKDNYWDTLPEGVLDPFASEKDQDEEEELLSGRYQIYDVISQNPQRAIYKGYDIKNDKSIVIKQSFCSGSQPHNEYKMLSKLTDSGYVPSPIDYSILDDKSSCMVMEMIAGGETLINIDLNPDQCGKLFVNLTKGLLDIHRSGVVHNDISPYNIMVKHNGATTYIDFELAYISGTKPIGGAYTPGFSPKQRSGTSLDDIYSLGATIYWCITGIPPTISGYEKYLQRFDVVDPTLKNIIIDCLSDNPNERPTLQSILDSLVDESVEYVKTTAKLLSYNEVEQSKKKLLQGLELCRNTPNSTDLYRGGAYCI